MRKLSILPFLLVLLTMLTACAQSPAAQTGAAPSAEVSAQGMPSAPGEAAASEETAAEAAEAETALPQKPDAEASAGSSDLIVYFSWSGNTRQVAEAIQAQTGADVFELVPAAPYPGDYDETVDIGQQEKREGVRPEFQGEVPDLGAYDRVFVGFPNWWGDMPMILYTFFDTYDLSGKTIAPFVTSSSSGFSGTRSAMQELEPGAQLTDGLDIKERDLDSATQSVTAWLEQIAPS